LESEGGLLATQWNQRGGLLDTAEPEGGLLDTVPKFRGSGYSSATALSLHDKY